MSKKKKKKELLVSAVIGAYAEQIYISPIASLGVYRDKLRHVQSQNLMKSNCFALAYAWKVRMEPNQSETSATLA